MPFEHGQDHQFQFGDVDVGEVGQLGGLPPGQETSIAP
jgi:hypothetical protein